MIEKYRMKELEAQYLADFLGKILKWEPKDRPSAREMLKHPWLKMAPQFDTKISRRESREYRRVNGYVVSPSRKASSTPSVEEKKKDRPSEEPV